MSEANAAHPTREAWLTAFIEAARPVFTAKGFPIPSNVRVAMGFPFGARKAIGQCWGSTASVDNHFEMFISPNHYNGLKAADTLTHELCHAVDECKHGHKAPFKRIALAVGLRGKMTSCGGEGVPEWHEWADPILAGLGPFPGAQLKPGDLGRKPQTTRMLKVECDTCGLILRTSAKYVARCVRCPDDECGGFLSCDASEGDE